MLLDYFSLRIALKRDCFNFLCFNEEILLFAVLRIEEVKNCLNEYRKICGTSLTVFTYSIQIWNEAFSE